MQAFGSRHRSSGRSWARSTAGRSVSDLLASLLCCTRIGLRQKRFWTTAGEKADSKKRSSGQPATWAGVDSPQQSFVDPFVLLSSHSALDCPRRVPHLHLLYHSHLLFQPSLTMLATQTYLPPAQLGHPFPPSAVRLAFTPTDPHPSPLDLPELLSLIFESLPLSDISPSLLTVCKPFHAALQSVLYRSVKLGEIPAWRKFSRAVAEGCEGAGWVRKLDLRITGDVLDRGLLDELGEQFQKGRFERLQNLQVLGSTGSAFTLDDTCPFAQSIRSVGHQLHSLTLEGNFSSSFVTSVLDSTRAVRSVSLQAATLTRLSLSTLFDAISVETVFVTPSVPFPSPGNMNSSHWVDQLVALDVDRLAKCLVALLARSLGDKRNGRPLQFDVGALPALGVTNEMIYQPLRVLTEEMGREGVVLMGLPEKSES